MIQLRDYQLAIIDETRNHLRAGIKSVLIQSATGSGKTALAARMLKTASDKGHGAWFCCHRRELVTQSAITFGNAGVDHGIVAAGFDGDRKRPVQICSIQTLARRWHTLARPRLIIWDECHHVAAASWGKVHAQFPDAVHIGLTATPERLDGTGLGVWFNKIVYGPPVRQLIDDGYLSDYRLFAPSAINTAGVHSKYGDFVKSELNKVVDKPRITGDAIQHYKKYCEGKRALIFAVSIEHSQHIVEQFNSAGIRAEHVDGTTESSERDSIFRRFIAGQTLALSNVEIAGEGVDIPAVEAAILLRPTQSLAMYLQQVGRALRPAVDKTHAIILDHAGNSARHGLPDDPREWSLVGTKSSKAKAEPDDVKVKQCPMCYATVRQHVSSCRHCGHVFVTVGREVEKVDGELAEVNIREQRIQMRAEQAQASSLEELIRIGKLRGYKNPAGWAMHVWGARRMKRVAA